MIYTSNAEKSNALNDFLLLLDLLLKPKYRLVNLFHDYIDNPHIHSIFLKQCEIEEVSHIINKLQASKACGLTVFQHIFFKFQLIF